MVILLFSCHSVEHAQGLGWKDGLRGFSGFTHSPESCIFRLIGDSYLPLGASLSLCVWSKCTERKASADSDTKSSGADSI